VEHKEVRRDVLSVGSLFPYEEVAVSSEVEGKVERVLVDETTKNLVLAFLLACIFMYMVLAAQFDSFVHPFTIMLSLPLSVPFALFSLWITGRTLNLWSALGVLLLLGIVKKNGILQVDATNQLRAKGMSRHEAIIEANHTRLRPILMTTVMLVAAMVPIALGQGPGAGARASMAKVIIGGQMLSLVLALLVTPVFYAILDGLVSLAKRLGIRFSVETSPLPEPLTAHDVQPVAGGV
jgi:hydrophobic/amphiphilic exporter-1 (mainly G- bacteria), HAE1 family